MNKLVFANKSAAVEYLRSQNYLVQMDNGNFYPHGTYYLAHGEYSQPEFTATRYKDGWGIKKIHYFYANTFHAPRDGRCAVLDARLVLESSIG